MSTSVIICGVRGPNGVDIASLKQMAGRAGRSKKDKNAIVHIVAESDCLDALKAIEDTPSVDSVFGNIDALAFNLLSKVVDGGISDIGGAEKWFSRSLWYAQRGNVDFKNVFQRLIECGAILMDNGECSATESGKVAVRYYFSPFLVHKWKSDFSSIVASGDSMDIFAVSWAVSSGLVSYDMETSGGNEILWRFPSEYRCSGSRGCEEAMWCAILERIPMRGVSVQRQSLKDDSSRIAKALESLGFPQLNVLLARKRTSDEFEGQ